MATEKDIDEQSRLLKILSAAYGKHTDDLQDYWSREAKSREYYLNKSKKQYQDIEAGIKNLKTKINTVGVTSDELEAELASLRAEIAKTTDADKKAALMKAKSELEMRNAGNKAIETIQSTAGKVIGIGLAGAITNMTAAVKRAAAGGSAMEVAAGLMEARVDTANQQFQAISGGMQEFGGALVQTGGKAKYLGLALTVAGAAAGFLSNQISELAKAGIGFLLTQTTKMMQGFQDLSKVGAVFAGGMMEMTHMALSAGMTIDQFSKVVEASRRELSSMGMGINEASKRMATVFSGPGGKKLQDGMYALGMAAEEQGQTVAQAMSLLAGPSGKLRASNAEVQATTAEYAKNLKIISNITGDDAKARMEKLRQDNDTLAFNSYLNTLSEKERARTVQAMNAMSAEDQRAFREKKVYGTVVSADLNAMRATNSGIRKAQDEMFAAADRGTLTVEGVAKTYETFQAEALTAANEGGKSFGLAMGGIGQDLAKSTNSTVQFMIKFADAQKGIAEIAESQKKGAQQSGAELMKLNQEFAVQMQQIAEKALPYFKDILITTANDISKSVKEALSNIGGPTAKGIWEKMLDFVKDYGISILTLGLAAGGGNLLKGIINKAPITEAATTAASKFKPGSFALPEMTAGGPTSAVGANKLGSMARMGTGLLKGGASALGGYALGALGNYETAQGNVKTGAGLDVGSKALEWGGTGAMMGSVIPGVGTAIGAGIGAAAGGAYGLYKNWGTLMSKTSTPATNAAGTMNPAQDTGSATMVQEAKDENTKMYDKIMEIAVNTKATADAMSKEGFRDLAEANRKLIDVQKDLTSYTKDMKETMAKLLQVSR